MTWKTNAVRAKHLRVLLVLVLVGFGLLAVRPARAVADGPPVVSVLDSPYLAPADGSANDTSAIQAALDDIAGTGGTVVLPAGHTYVVSHLDLGDATTLRIDGDVVQATDASFYPYTVIRGPKVTGVTNGAYTLDAGFVNLPLIMAKDVSDVTVTGTGSLHAMTGTDSQIIHVTPIGLTGVTNFDIGGLTIQDSNFWTMRVNQSNSGRVHDMTLYSRHHNSDGVDLINSQDVTIDQNDFDTADDDVVVRTEGPGLLQLIAQTGGYQTWADFSNPQATKNITVKNNHLKSVCCGGLTLIPWTWGGSTPTFRQGDLEISGVTALDNVISSPDPLRCWCNVTSNSSGITGYSMSAGLHNPVKDVTILDNTITSTNPDSQWTIRNLRDVTSLTTDLPSLLKPSTGQLSWPGDAAFTVPTGGLARTLPNGDFEADEVPVYWSSTGDTGVASASATSALSSANARAAAATLGSWGRFGFVQGQDRASSLSEGIGLAGDDVMDTAASTYRLKLKAVTSSAGATLVARDQCGGGVIAERPFTATTPQEVEMTIPVATTCGHVDVGVEVAAGTNSWALVDQAKLADAVADPLSALSTTIDDASSATAYTGTWRTDLSASLQAGTYDSTLHYSNTVGSTVTLSWHGGRAQVLGLTQNSFEAGSADVWVDGVSAGAASWYRNVPQTFQDVVFDTGPLPVGDHTIKFEVNGDSPSLPTVMNHYISVDALRVLPIVADDASSATAYTGTWRTDLSASLQAGTYDSTLHYSNTVGSTVTLSWHGGRAQVLGLTQNSFEAGSADVWVDGVSAGAASWYRDVPQTFQDVVFDTGPLPVGDHTIKFEVNGDSPSLPTVMNHYISIDALNFLP